MKICLICWDIVPSQVRLLVLVCNMLFHIIQHIGGPLYLIIEFAMHGNLRSFLNMCEEAVLKLNRQPMITRKRSRIGSSSSTSSAHHLLSSRVPTSAHTPDSQGHFTFPPIGSSAGTLPEEYRVAHAGTPMTSFAHTVAPISTDYVNCKGLIQMEDVQNFALQIASGLKHMEAMNVCVYVMTALLML